MKQTLDQKLPVLDNIIKFRYLLDVSVVQNVIYRSLYSDRIGRIIPKPVFPIRTEPGLLLVEEEVEIPSRKMPFNINKN